MSRNTYTAAQITEMFPSIAANLPEIAAQLVTDNGAWDAKDTHPEIWMPGNTLDYFLSTGGIAPKSEPVSRPRVIDLSVYPARY